MAIHKETNNSNKDFLPNSIRGVLRILERFFLQCYLLEAFDQDETPSRGSARSTAVPHSTYLGAICQVLFSGLDVS